MLDRVQEASAQELERAIERRVEHEFEAARRSGARETPIIGGAFDPDDADLKHDVVRALLARKWAERELPPWMLPLPLSYDDCMLRPRWQSPGDVTSAVWYACAKHALAPSVRAAVRGFLRWPVWG